MQRDIDVKGRLALATQLGVSQTGFVALSLH